MAEPLPLKPFIVGVPEETLGIPKTPVSINLQGSVNGTQAPQILLEIPSGSILEIRSMTIRITNTSVVNHAYKVAANQNTGQELIFAVNVLGGESAEYQYNYAQGDLYFRGPNVEISNTGELASNIMDVTITGYLVQKKLLNFI